MLLFTLAFLMGDLYLQTFSTLPSTPVLSGCCAVGGILYVILRRRLKKSYLLLGLAFGFSYSAWYAASLLSWSLPKTIEGKSITVIGTIASIPIEDPWQTKFMLATDQALLQIGWPHPDKKLNVGDRWRLQVKLQRIHGTQNPGSFDYEGWALQKKIRATGVVLREGTHQLLGHDWYDYPITHLRQKIYRKILDHSSRLQNMPWLIALIIGEHHGAPETHWQILRNTGTNHLMAIAGLHIGMIVGAAHFLFSWLWRRSQTLLLLFPAQLAALSFTLIVAILYSALAGFSIPTERACIMLTALIVASLLKIEVNRWRPFSLALGCVLLLNPLSVLTESFWLSFGTLSLIIYGMSGRINPKGLWWKLGRVQWVIAVGLIPLTLALFQQCSLISFFANSIAIPWLGFGVLPFCFVGGLSLLVFPEAGYFLIGIADHSLSLLWIILGWFSHLPHATFHYAMPNIFIFISFLVGCLLFLMPRGLPGRVLGIIFLTPLFVLKSASPKEGDVWFTLLDVGQGLSAIVQTKTHCLVFDTGPKYLSSDMGERVLLPYLYSIGSKKVDMLVVSHGDNDHIGGAQALLSALPVASIRTSVPDKLPTPVTQPCEVGESWEWDHVHFKFLHPLPSQDVHIKNDRSCVLRVNVGHRHILLTGDIEKRAEYILIRDQSKALTADILIAPHHGSKTSNMKVFMDAVHPHFVLYATGYRNRYHFPHPDVVATYAQMGASQLNTAETGAIQFKLERRKSTLLPSLYRQDRRRYWFDK